MGAMLTSFQVSGKMLNFSDRLKMMHGGRDINVTDSCNSLLVRYGM